MHRSEISIKIVRHFEKGCKVPVVNIAMYDILHKLPLYIAGCKIIVAGMPIIQYDSTV